MTGWNPQDETTKRPFPNQQVYSIQGDTDTARSRLASLKVFKTASGTPTLDIVDVTRTQSQAKTFNKIADLISYLDINPSSDLTRLM